jgi:hypothetical protein
MLQLTMYAIHKAHRHKPKLMKELAKSSLLDGVADYLKDNDEIKHYSGLLVGSFSSALGVAWGCGPCAFFMGFAVKVAITVMESILDDTQPNQLGGEDYRQFLSKLDQYIVEARTDFAGSAELNQLLADLQP